uniref:RING-type domain-containing protein n=1 Tax=Phytophthora ramorum TaxID=164328 RepID=H3HCZ0_PHYRM
MAKTSLANREQVPIRCCSKEFPMDYVKLVLAKGQFAQYERFLAERDPRSSTLQSDQDYAKVVRQVKGKQCPVCGIGVVKISGCNAMQCTLGHVFCWNCLHVQCTCGKIYHDAMEVLPTLRELEEPAADGHFEHVVYLNSDTNDFVDEVAGREEAAVEAQLAEAYALEVYSEEIRRAEQIVLDEAVALSFYAKEEHKLLHPAEADQEADSADETLAVREFPSDYVREALNVAEFVTYERFLQDKPWRALDLQSDREYTRVVQLHQGVQCPGCGVGVQKSMGCNRMACLNGHEFCFLCGRKWKTCGCSYY